MSNLELIDPTGSTEVSHLHAPRLDDLRGKTVAMLSDDMWQAHRMLPLLRQQLEARFDGRTLLLGVERLDYTKGIVQKLRAFERYLELGVDGGYFGDDYGAQVSTLFSPVTWRELVKPRLGDNGQRAILEFVERTPKEGAVRAEA